MSIPSSFRSSIRRSWLSAMRRPLIVMLSASELKSAGQRPWTVSNSNNSACCSGSPARVVQQNDLGVEFLDQCAQDQLADPPQPIDSHFCHCLILFKHARHFCRECACHLPLQTAPRASDPASPKTASEGRQSRTPLRVQTIGRLTSIGWSSMAVISRSSGTPSAIRPISRAGLRVSRNACRGVRSAGRKERPELRRGPTGLQIFDHPRA